MTGLLLILALSVVSATHSRGAELTPQQQGRAIFEEADRRASGYGDFEVELQMILRSPRGVATQRALRIKQLEVPQDGDKILLVFDSPADVRGTALLSHAHKQADDDQWLFLPAIKRVKKIASKNRGSPFVGSEFSFEDLSPPELEKYRYVFLGEGSLEEVPCYIVERVSVRDYTAYSKEVFWLDQAEYRVLQVEYYDLAGRLEKRLSVSGYANYNGFWKPAQMDMQNLITHRSTQLLWQNYRFNVGLDANRDLSVNSLRRAR